MQASPSHFHSTPQMCLGSVWSVASQLSQICKTRWGLPRKMIFSEVPRRNVSPFNFFLFAGTSGTLLFVLDGSYLPGQFFPLGNMPVTLNFKADGGTADQGFRISFYIGESSPGKYNINCGLQIFQKLRSCEGTLNIDRTTEAPTL